MPPGHGDRLVGIDYASGWASVTAKSITVDPSRAESKDSAKVELIDRVGHKLPRIDRFDRLNRFRGLSHTYNKVCCKYSILG